MHIVYYQCKKNFFIYILHVLNKYLHNITKTLEVIIKITVYIKTFGTNKKNHYYNYNNYNNYNFNYNNNNNYYNNNNNINKI